VRLTFTSAPCARRHDQLVSGDRHHNGTNLDADDIRFFIMRITMPAQQHNFQNAGTYTVVVALAMRRPVRILSDPNGA
jgi:hypothetical protein